jgi:NifU-like protein involved in Fe-S cluster formation
MTQILILCAVLLVFSLAWFALSYLFTPEMKQPDGIARVTGNCGDTMEIGLKIDQGTVVATHTWTDGCNMSKQCVESAARISFNKPVKQVRGYNMTHIIEEVGRVPEDHLHCAQLAEITLQKALDDYLSSR